MDAMGGILTKGLGASACNSLIYGPFRLKCYVSLPPIIPTTTQGGGGSHVRAGSTAAHIIQIQHDRIQRQNAELAEEQDERNAKLYEKRLITLVIGFNQKTIQKEYIVDKDRANKIVKIISIVNKTMKAISTSISSFRQMVVNAVIKKKR